MVGLTNPWLELQAKEGEPLARLDVWLASKLETLSRRKVQTMIQAGDVTVNGKTAKKGNALTPGCTVAIWSTPPVDKWNPLPDPTIPLSVLYEDAYLAAVDKPSGIPSVPLSADEKGTLANSVVARFPTCAAIGRSPGDGGLVQRLDHGTSGVVLVGKTAPIFDALVVMQNKDEIEKIYTALVPDGDLSLPRIIHTPLSRADKGGRKVKPDQNGIPARTGLRSIRRHGKWLLVEASIHQGRRHQIRVHLACAGFPIAGDPIYGSKEAPPGLQRMFLHASKLKLTHPITQSQMEFFSPLPTGLASIVGNV
jgi:23S rRNA pseudouridine1911/1915/1917 synthase